MSQTAVRSLQSNLSHLLLTDQGAFQAIPTSNAPYSDLPPIISAFFEAKARKGLTFDDIAKQIGKDEIWLASAFYGQVRSKVLFISHLSLGTATSKSAPD